MHLVYVDEVKVNPPHQPFYYLCGLAVPIDDMTSIEKAMNALAEGYFGTRSLDKDTEFHASQIISQKGPFRGRPMDGRIALFKSLLDVINAHPNLGRITVRLDPRRMSRSDHQRIAFMYLVERVDALMTARKSKALLIVDHDREFEAMNVTSLDAYKARGTDFAYGTEINNVVDTVHHTHSHYSRLLQLADVYAYTVSMREQKEPGYPRPELVKHVAGLQNFGHSKYKYWPPEGDVV